jgi:NAD(P)-dependent dehydrogenase (short-subunit alcohol dehydrogenase family)
MSEAMARDLKDRVAIVTGANSGIGEVTARELAARGAEVWLACRNEQKAKPVIEEIVSDTGNDRVHFLQLDLGSLANVSRAARGFLAEDRPLHLLINNAGLAGQQGVTDDGFELAFGVNHVGHFLFTALLEDRIRESAPARIVNVASTAHYKAPGIDYEKVRQPTQTVTGLDEYQISKLANVLHAKSLARRLDGTGVTTYSLHPGVVASDVWRRVPPPFRWVMKLFMISNEEGAKTTLYCATSDDVADQSGRYYDECREKEPSAAAQDEAAAEELWERSQDWVKPHLQRA